jgi:hypothetical protein
MQREGVVKGDLALARVKHGVGWGAVGWWAV